MRFDSRKSINLRPGWTRWASLQCSPKRPSWIWAAERTGKGEGEKGKEGLPPPQQKFWLRPCQQGIQQVSVDSELVQRQIKQNRWQRNDTIYNETAQHTARWSLEIILLHSVNCEVVSGSGRGYRRNHNQQRDKEQERQRETAAKHFHHFSDFVQPHDGVLGAIITN